MRIVVLGKNGLLGNYIYSYLSNFYKDVIGITRKQLDALTCSIYDIQNVIEDADVVINCIGIIHQKHDMEKDKKIFIRVNSIFPHMLASICLDKKLIHITTDCVFSGRKGNYNEKDEHDETNIYGISKSLGEPSSACVIRTSIIGEQLNDKEGKSLLNWVKSNKNGEIKGFTSHLFSGVTCLELSKIIYKIISERLYWKGVRHIYSNTVSKYELVSLINKYYDLNIKVNEYKTLETVDKSLTSIYDKMFDIPTLEEQIKELSKFKLS